MSRLRLLLACLLLISPGCSSPKGDANEDAVIEPQDLVVPMEVVDGSLPDLHREDLLPAPDLAPEILPPSGPYSGFAPSGAYIQDMLGVSTHMSRHVEYSWKREAELDRLEELEFTRVRSDFYWKEIEPVEDAYDVSGPSHLTDLCLDRGLSVLGILLIPPTWAMPDGTTSSVDPEKFRDYVKYTVGQMKDRVHSWEIWNEQNLDVFWGPVPNPTKFGIFLKIAAEEIRALDPDAEIVFGGLSPFQFQPEGIWAFLQQVGDAHPDICDSFDSLAIHPYSFAQQYAPEFNFVQGLYVHPPLTGLIDDVRLILEGLGCPDVPIHLTEAGWPDYYMGVEKQGAYSARGLLLAAAAGAASYYWYTFWDSTIGPDEVAPTECTFGLMTVPSSAEEPGEKKPSFQTLKGANSMLKGSRYAGDLGPGLDLVEDLHALAFVDDGARFTVTLWHSQDDLETEMELEIPGPEGATSWNLYDHTGAVMETGDTMPVTIAVTGRVSYLKFL